MSTQDQSPPGPIEDTAETSAVKRERSGFGAVLVVLVMLALLVGGGWAAAYFFAEDRLPSGTTVAGVGIGNLTADAAEQRLREQLENRLDEAVQVQVGGNTARVVPARAGLSIDVEATVARAGAERSWDPRDLWNHYTGGDEVAPVLDLDEAAFDTALERLDTALGAPARDGAVAFGKDGVQVTDAAVGQGLDPDELRDALVEAIPSDERTVELALHEVVPDIDQADVQQALTSFANPAMAAPVTLVFGESPVALRPQQYAAALRLEPQGDALVPGLDEKALQELVAAGIADDASAPVDATVRIVGGKPQVVPARPGVAFDPAEVSRVFLDLVTKPEGQRRAPITATVAEPEVSTADAQAWQIKERVSTFTTHFPYAEYRNTNIGRAAELVNGTVVEPGETFSLNGVVGERTRENGFTEGWTIQEGIFRADLGGGVSQLATTTFNAMFFAGLKDVEHKAHSLYISRYPVGREATVAWGALDLRFQNDTPYGVLVTTGFTPSTPGRQGSVTVSMWSTKVWDITTRTSGRYAFTDFKTRTVTDGNCEPTEGARGFSVDVWRYFSKPGSDTVEKTEKFHTVYRPQDHVICKTPRVVR